MCQTGYQVIHNERSRHHQTKIKSVVFKEVRICSLILQQKLLQFDQSLTKLKTENLPINKNVMKVLRFKLYYLIQKPWIQEITHIAQLCDLKILIISVILELNPYQNDFFFLIHENSKRFSFSGAQEKV